jgi:hypothetical protein
MVPTVSKQLPARVSGESLFGELFNDRIRDPAETNGQAQKHALGNFPWAQE